MSPWWIVAGLAVGALVLARRQRRRSPSCPPLRNSTYAGFRYGLFGYPNVIFFHGRGGSEVNFEKKIGSPGVYVRGPVQLQTGYAWMQAEFTDPEFVLELEAIVNRLAPFLRGFSSCYGAPVLAGHSQGGVVALLLALRYPKLVRSVVVASAALPRSFWSPFEVPVTLVQGSMDEVVNPQTVQEMAEAIEAGVVMVEGSGHALKGELLETFKLRVAGDVAT